MPPLHVADIGPGDPPVLPHTGLHKRLVGEGRLTEGWDDITQTSLLGFELNRPMTEIAHDYVEVYEKLYEPTTYVRRVLGMNQRLGPWVRLAPKSIRREIAFLLRVPGQRGFAGEGRIAFWFALLRMALRDSTCLMSFLLTLVQFEHFASYKANVVNAINRAVEERGRAPQSDRER